MSTETPERASCTRKPGSAWTACTCPDCRARNARLAKLVRCGRAPKPPQTERARTRLRAWIAAGWSPAAVASAIGINEPAAYQLMKSHRDVDRPMQHATVIAILNAHPQPTAGFVYAIGARRRLQALARLGWGLSDLSRRTGLPEPSLSTIRNGVVTQTHATAARTIDDVYRQLEFTPGPSQRARNQATRAGWGPPAVWDDDLIDDPAAEPQGIVGPRGEGQGADLVDRVVLDRVRELAQRGESDEVIGHQVGLTTSGVQKLRHRYGIEKAA